MGKRREEKLVAYAEEFLGSLQDATAFDILEKYKEK